MEKQAVRVQLERMPQLVEAVEYGDDWTGMSDPAARRKRQNRLHQRAWRKRKALGALSENHTVAHFERSTEYNDLDNHETIQRQTHPSRYALPTYSRTDVLKYPHDSLSPSNNETETEPSLISILYPTGILPPQAALSIALNITPAITNPLIPPLLPYLNPSTSHLPLLPIYFPLTPDHRLITLFQYNVLRATLTNMSILSLLHHLPTYCSSALQISLISPPLSSSPIPSDLTPTLLQKTIPHDFWIDIMPSAQMRDNLILNKEMVDQEELCGDVIGGLYEGFDEVESRGMVIWGEPWEEEGWEVSEGFAVKWGFLLRGCGKMIDATNARREERGEERLKVLDEL